MATIKIAIRSESGIMALKQVLNKGVEAAKLKKADVEIEIIGAPRYMLKVSS